MERSGRSWRSTPMSRTTPASSPRTDGETDGPTIICTTLVGAKGLSAEHVFIVGMNNGASLGTPGAVTDDEVCKLIVGLSRTRKACHLVSCGCGPVRRSRSPAASSTGSGHRRRGAHGEQGLLGFLSRRRCHRPTATVPCDKSHPRRPTRPPPLLHRDGASGLRASAGRLFRGSSALALRERRQWPELDPVSASDGRGRRRWRRSVWGDVGWPAWAFNVTADARAARSGTGSGLSRCSFIAATA